VSPAELNHFGAREEQHSCRRQRDCRGDVAPAVEERPLTEGGARSFAVEHLLAAPERDLANLHAPVGDDEEAATGLPFLEEGLARPKAAD
jgi:hypothetical protein